MQCKKCGSPLRRLARQGLMQGLLYPILGLYPWECPRCRKPVLRRSRGERKRRPKKEVTEKRD